VWSNIPPVWNNDHRNLSLDDELAHT
jgi:hypothetical protein